MATANTNHIRIQNAENLVGNLANQAGDGLSYLFIGKSSEWSTGDENPPTPTNNQSEYNQLFRQMLALKRVNYNKVFRMTERVIWSSGTVFDMYRHDYSSSNRATSGASNLINSRFVTVNSNSDVYVCLNNNGGQSSTIEPLNTDNETFSTSDGYQWLKVYSISSDDMTNHTTATLMPVVENSVVSTTAGSIYTVLIDSPGSTYTSSPAGATNQIDYYYCNIRGDGTGAVARVAINTQGGVQSVEVVRNGSGYTKANLDFRATAVYSSLTDLDAGTNALDPLGDGAFTSTVIIGPTGGWGTDIYLELGATKVGVFSDLNYNELDFLNGITFRQIGIIKGVTTPLTNPDTMNATYAVKLTTQNAAAAIYTAGEEITQQVTIGGETKTAKGTVIHWDGTDEINGNLTYFQDPELHSDTDGGVYAFQSSGFIIGTTTGKIGSVDNFTGTDANREFGTGYASPEVNYFTGELLYLSNISPVLRSTTQTEKVTIIISY